MTVTASLDDHLLDHIRSALVIDLGELRASLPAGWRGRMFDAAILRLADAQQIVLSQDCLPESLTAVQQQGYVRWGRELYTVASRR